jgi:hypothetical protein
MNIDPENCRCLVKMNSQKGGNSASFKVKSDSAHGWCFPKSS